MRRAHDEGFIMITLLVLMIPMLLIVGAVTTAMTGKRNELAVELQRERCLLAAESGIDDAIYQGELGNLVSGSGYKRVLGPDSWYEVMPTYLRSDGLDNDNDGSVDEQDEDVFQVIVTGGFRSDRRRLAAYLGPVPLLPTLSSAVTITDPSIQLKLNGSALISGIDVDMNGNPTGATYPGLSIAPPGTTATLAAELTPAEGSKVVGTGPSPSLGTSPALDVMTLVAQVQNFANLVLTSNVYASYSFGNGPGGTTTIAYRNGNVRFSGNTQGAGILVVTGDMTLTGTFRFDGVVIVLGDLINASGTADVYGSILLGPSASLLDVRGTMNMHYSTQAVQLANSSSGRYVSFNGWQELSR